MRCQKCRTKALEVVAGANGSCRKIFVVLIFILRTFMRKKMKLTNEISDGKMKSITKFIVKF